MYFNRIGLSIIGLCMLVLLAACNEEEESRPTRYFQSGIKVKVIHPVKGSGPGFLVRFYDRQEAIQNTQPNKTAVTDSTGQAYFKDVRIGICYLECVVPDSLKYYGLIEASVELDSIVSVELPLKPQ